MPDRENIYEVSKVSLISHDSQTFDTSEYVNILPKQVESARKGVETLLASSGCYFSFYADLTMTM